jgi:hypothetical protein
MLPIRTVTPLLRVAGVATAGRVAAGTDPLAPVRTLATNLTNDVTGIAAAVAVLFIALNGIRYITAGGNPGRQSEAKSGIAAAAVGLAVALSANVVVHVVLAALR